MKKCPYCLKEISLRQFITNYGSDTLVARPAGTGAVHPREHVCIHCRRKFWIKSRPQKLYLVFRKYLGFLITLGAAGWFVGKIFFHFHTEKAVGLGIVLILLFLPVYTAYVKYQTIELKPEE